MLEHVEEDYQGPATVFTEDREIAVEVVLRGHFQPIDGRFHWYGRVAANDEISDLAGSRKRDVVLRTTKGEAVGTLSDPDTWNRYRITGLGHPPWENPVRPSDEPRDARSSLN